MRHDVLGARAGFTVLLTGALLALLPGASFAEPTPGPDCGAGASIVGSDEAGKVTVGDAPDDTCTLTFSATYTRPPACVASEERARPVALGARTTRTTVVIDIKPVSPGNAVSYICLSY